MPSWFLDCAAGKPSVPQRGTHLASTALVHFGMPVPLHRSSTPQLTAVVAFLVSATLFAALQEQETRSWIRHDLGIALDPTQVLVVGADLGIYRAVRVLGFGLLSALHTHV